MGERVLRVDACRLAVEAGVWAFARDNAAAIREHWGRRNAESPAMFDGIIHLSTRWSVSARMFEAAFVRTDFKSYLFWREQGYPEAGVRSGFGSALIRAAAGEVLLGRQRAGHINAGLAYPPGGFIDARDIRADGTIDIDASIARELAEETGLSPTAGARWLPGYLIAPVGYLFSIGRQIAFPLDAEALAAKVRSHIAAETDPELADVVVIGSRRDLMRQNVPEYARLLADGLLGEDAG